MTLIPTAKAAAQLGVDPSTLWRWKQDGLVHPAWITPGRQARWDMQQLRAELKMEDHVPDEATTPEPQPVVAAIVTCELGVLIGARNDGKPPWTFIAGEIEPGEAQTDAAVREVKEETGLLVRCADHEIGRRVHPATGRTMTYLACSPTHGTDVFVGDEEELSEVRWASLDEVNELMGASNIYEPVASYLAAALK